MKQFFSLSRYAKGCSILSIAPPLITARKKFTNLLHICLTKRILLCGTLLFSACSVVEETESTVTYSVTPVVTTNYSVQIDTTPLPVAAEAVPAPAQTDTATPTAISPNTPTPSLTKTPDTTPTPTAIAVATSTSPLVGPLIAYRVQNGQNYLLLLDVGTLTLREIKQDHLAIPFAMQWLDRGCRLYVRGNIIDLQGNIVEKTNDPEDGEAHFQVRLLSPDKKMGARELFLGRHDDVELEYLSLEILDRTNPDRQLSIAPNGGAYAYAWSPDGNWLAFTDYDDNAILQVYRATPDGLTIDQLTTHSEDPGVINLLEWSPNGEHIAYAASALLPGQFEAGYGGWIGLISLSDSQTVSVTPGDFGYATGLWWSQDSERIAFLGESFSNISPGTDLASTKTYIYWADRKSGAILKNFNENQAPSQSLSLALPVGNLDTVFFAAKGGFYLLDATSNSLRKVLAEIPTDGLIRDLSTSPFDFPGEASCSTLIDGQD